MIRTAAAPPVEDAGGNVCEATASRSIPACALRSSKSSSSVSSVAKGGGIYSAGEDNEEEEEEEEEVDILFKATDDSRTVV